MTSILEQLKDSVSQALMSVNPELADTDPLIAPTNNPKFGDYQSNVALSLAKPLKQNPRAIAQTIVDNLQIEDICEKPTIAGPGFINFIFLSNSFEVFQNMESVSRTSRTRISIVSNSIIAMAQISQRISCQQL